MEQSTNEDRQPPYPEGRHRISAGGIIIKDNAILLVRYRATDGSTFLVGPGGALEHEENAAQAIIRETFEETGVFVRPHRVLWIEDLQGHDLKASKTWMLCEVVSGEAELTEGAKAESIIDVGWYRRNELDNEVVYPQPVKEYDWNEFTSPSWETLCLPSRTADI